MMRTLFGLLLILHGLIHVMGFVKAFNIAEIEQFTLSISKPAGLFWVIASLLFLISGALFFNKQSWWWMAAVPAILISQALIFLYWQDAKAGTILNIIILVGCLVGYGNWDFQAMVDREKKSFFAHIRNNQVKVEPDELEELPAMVRLWMENSGVSGNHKINSALISQKGKMKTDHEGNWMKVETEQFVRTADPGFLWIAEVEAVPYIHLAGRDKYVEGQGHMLIKLLSLIPVADSKGVEINQGSLLRYLAETVWYPSAALEEYISWEEIDSTSVIATMNFGGNTASGVFEFNNIGEPVRFEAERYYDREGGATLETWVIDIDEKSYKSFSHYRVPTKAAVTWKLPDGDFTWFRLEITDITYDLSDPSLFLIF